MRLKDISKHQLFDHIYAYNQPPRYFEEGWHNAFNSREKIKEGDDYWDGNYYGEKVKGPYISPCHLLGKGIYRTILMLTKDPKKEYGKIIYNEDTKELWCSYFDGTQEEFNDIISGNVNAASLPIRFINMYGKEGIIKKANIKTFINDIPLELPSAYVVGDGDGKHSIAAYLFFQFATYLCEETDVKISEQFYKLVDNITKINSFTNIDKAVNDLGKRLNRMENDFIVSLISNSEGQSPNIPFSDFDFPGCNNSNYITMGNVETVVKTKKKRTLKKEMSIKDMVKTKKFFVEHEFATGDEKLVPKSYDDYIVDKETENCALLIKNMSSLPEQPVMNMLFTGEAGTGKSTAAQIIARLCNLPYRFITMSADTTVADLLLNILPGKKANTFDYFESEFVKSFKNGGIIEIQEVNTVRKPNVLTSLNAALDDLKELHLPNGEVIKRHKNCVVIFTANVGYNGTGDMNQALLSRCFWKAEYKLPKDDVLAKRLVEKAGVELDVAINMVKAMKDVKKVLEENGEINGICSIRELTAWAKATKLLGDAVIAAENTIVNSSSFDEDIKCLVSQVISNYFA